VRERATGRLSGDPALAAAASALEEAGHWAEVVDARWHAVHLTDELRLGYGRVLERVQAPLEVPYFGPEAVDSRLTWPAGPNTIEIQRAQLRAIGAWALHDLGGDRAAMRELVDPRLRDLVDELSPGEPAPLLSFRQTGTTFGSGAMGVHVTAVRIREADGRLAGTALVYKPLAGMAMLVTLAGLGDPRHVARMQSVARAGRRPAAMLFADLESSSRLARRLSTAGYFLLGRRLVRAADECVIDAGGLVGRHAGDGVVAFFLAEHAGSESAAARACIAAARGLRTAMADVGARGGLGPEAVVLRFGLHWGSTVFVGQVVTGGRSEVNALGDEVNETARIEACATGGRALASKDLLERLQPGDAAALELDPAHVGYTALGDLVTATEKARRDAPAIAVCEV
jgi:class 3 adenylate cyclase